MIAQIGKVLFDSQAHVTSVGIGVGLIIIAVFAVTATVLIASKSA